MQNNLVKVAIYCRLSRDDEDNTFNQNSESITNQKNMLTQYALERKWDIYNYYIDDGYTGLNFDRPGFIQMQSDIKNNCFNTIIVKDQSRIGRDNAGVDRFLYELLPQRNIRCIGVLDGLDTFNEQNKKASQVMGLTNEWYAEDISKKVRGALDTKRKNGEFIGAIAPYGYKKSEKNKNKLIIDEEVSWVIKKIFELYLEGNGYVKIAKILNDENIPSPSNYKNIYNYNATKIKENKRAWSYHTIRRILSSEVYKGNLVQKTQKVISYKSKKKIQTHPSERIIVKGTHEPIIEQHIFDLTQEMISKKTKARPYIGQTHLFSGMVRCGDCGRMMQYRSDSDTFDCSTFKQYGSKYCSSHKLKGNDLNKIIYEVIKKSLIVFNEEKKQEKEAKAKNKQKSKDLTIIKLSKVDKRLYEINSLKKDIYEDYRNKVLTKEEFLELKNSYQDEENTLIDNKTHLENLIKKNKEENLEYNNWEYLYNKYINVKELNREMLIDYVNDINIYNTNNNIVIDINYKFNLN